MPMFNWFLIILLIMSSITLVGTTRAANYYVNNSHSKANNENPGIHPDLPLKTISAGLLKAFHGDSIWIDSGTYRESLVIPRSGLDAKKPISIRALPNADVKIKGSDSVTNWIKHSNSIWKRLDWPINSQQVFIDGFPLQQIGTNSPLNQQIFNKKPILPHVGKDLKDMVPGSFFYDQKAKILYVQLLDRSDPNTHLVEGSVRDFIIPPKDLSFIVLERLNFSHSNLTSKGLIMGIVNVWGKSWDISGCSFNFGDFAGMSVIGEDHKISNNTFNSNGNLGISINGSDENHKWAPITNRPPQNILLTGNETSHNNYRKFELSWQHGGIKAAVSCNTVAVMEHIAKGNYGAGIWFDGFCKNINVERSVVSGNLVGIAYEISDDAVISNNLVIGNEFQGIYVSASNEVKVFNNTVDENGFGIVLHGIPRQEHPTLQKNTIRNNIISESKFVDLVIYNNSPTATGNTSDYNLFFRGGKDVKITWTANTRYDVTHTNLQSFAKQTGQDLHSLNADPLWTDKGSGNYALLPASPAVGSGTTEIEGIGNIAHGDQPTNEKGKEKGKRRVDIGALAFQPHKNIHQEAPFKKSINN